MSEYKVKSGTIVTHLYKYISEGNSIRTDGLYCLLSHDVLTAERIETIFEEIGIEFLKPVFEKLNGQISYDDLNTYRLAAAAGIRFKQ